MSYDGKELGSGKVFIEKETLSHENGVDLEMWMLGTR